MPATQPPAQLHPTDDGWSTPSTARDRDRRRRDRDREPSPSTAPSSHPPSTATAPSQPDPPSTATTPSQPDPPRATEPPRESVEAHKAKLNHSRHPTPTPGDPRALYLPTQPIAPTHHSPYSHRSSLIAHPALPLAILVLDCPSDPAIAEYIALLKEHGIRDVVRICEAGVYDEKPMAKAGITVHDSMKFEDGTVPSKEVIDSWHALFDAIASHPDGRKGIATHCISGIGRAPLFAAISLIDAGLDPLEAIDVVRKKRRGAFNKRQVEWLLDGYKPRRGRNKGHAKEKEKEKPTEEREKKKGLFGGLFGKKK